MQINIYCLFALYFKENYPEDIYPLEIISDKNILGSCTTYRTRLDITHLIRTEDDQCIRTHQEVLRRYASIYLCNCMSVSVWAVNTFFITEKHIPRNVSFIIIPVDMEQSVDSR